MVQSNCWGHSQNATLHNPGNQHITTLSEEGKKWQKAHVYWTCVRWSFGNQNKIYFLLKPKSADLAGRRLTQLHKQVTCETVWLLFKKPRFSSKHTTVNFSTTRAAEGVITLKLLLKWVSTYSERRMGGVCQKMPWGDFPSQQHKLYSDSDRFFCYCGVPCIFICDELLPPGTWSDTMNPAYMESHLEVSFYRPWLMTRMMSSCLLSLQKTRDKNIFFITHSFQECQQKTWTLLHVLSLAQQP